MIQNRDIVVVGLQPWDIKIGSNCKNIALELSRRNRVLYVNAPVDRITRLRLRKEPGMIHRMQVRRTAENLLPIADNLWNLYPKRLIESINWMPEGFLYRAVNRRNNKRLAQDIREAMATLGFKDIILFNDSDMFRSFYLPELLKPDISIYYSRDNLMAVPYFMKHGRRMEPALMAKSTLVSANSEYLADLAREHNPNSFYVGQGCDLSLFDPSRGIPELPADLATIKRPIIGYIGAILSYRLDLPLLVELCARHPEWSFVFVGKEDEAFATSELHRLPNVHFLGLKKEDQLPSYLAHFDVAMNPQSINGMTEGNYPRKIDEYLAMGKPVVATATKTMSMFREHVYMGTTSAEYADLIARALRENGAEKALRRMEFARGHTWENSVAAISAAVEKVTAGRVR
ncbi:MAG: glycosyltransferase [Bacteroidetes bacterium]|nr:glycosyltransferase [Bacteroidota bacterium]